MAANKEVALKMAKEDLEKAIKELKGVSDMDSPEFNLEVFKYRLDAVNDAVRRYNWLV